MNNVKRNFIKSFLIIIISITLIIPFFSTVNAAVGPTSLYQEKITLYSGGVGTTQDVIFIGSNLHVSAKLISAPIQS